MLGRVGEGRRGKRQCPRINTGIQLKKLTARQPSLAYDRPRPSFFYGGGGAPFVFRVRAESITTVVISSPSHVSSSTHTRATLRLIQTVDLCYMTSKAAMPSFNARFGKRSDVDSRSRVIGLVWFICSHCSIAARS